MSKSQQSERESGGGYQPLPPETQSAVSIWAVRVELILTAALALAVVVYIKRPPQAPSIEFTPVHTPSIDFSGEPADLASAQADEEGPDAVKGQALFTQTCTSCHGPTAEGLPRMGPNLRQSRFVASTSDLRLIAFLKSGRPATDPKNTTGVPMPPRGGNFALDDESLADIVAFLRQVQKQ